MPPTVKISPRSIVVDVANAPERLPSEINVDVLAKVLQPELRWELRLCQFPGINCPLAESIS